MSPPRRRSKAKPRGDSTAAGSSSSASKKRRAKGSRSKRASTTKSGKKSAKNKRTTKSSRSAKSKRSSKSRKRKATGKNRRKTGVTSASWREWLKHWWRGAALLSLGVLVGIGLTIWFGYRWFARRPAAQHTEPLAVHWPADLNAVDAAALLADLGLTDRPAWMSLFLRANKAPKCFQPGPHLLPAPATPEALLAALCRSETRPTVTLTIPEGFHRFAMAKRVQTLGIASAEAFLHATGDREALYAMGVEPAALPVADTAEGFLFPATYELPIDSDPSALVRRLLAESNLRWKRLLAKHPGGWEKLQADFGFTRREVITLAAMVEKEAVVAEERPIIASVFLNRLRDPAFRRLQSDPTAMYGCVVMGDKVPACANYKGRATPAINRDPANAFSTYVTDNLPPGPICNPGLASIEAVLAPAETKFRFFVAKGRGRHHFSVTYAEHLAVIKRSKKPKPTP